MRRVAASRVFINEKEFHNNHVVELFEHLVVNHYPLEGELPMTEWLGGTIIIRGKEAYHTSVVLSPTELSTDDSCCYGHIQRL
ncbi:MAG: hypothetical protein IKQ62_05345 [Bacteroidaceae bacterium]|nr:hypothetical protein [Bacteroidaceae bacterium]